MKRALGALAPVIFAAALSGCGGSAAPATPIASQQGQAAAFSQRALQAPALSQDLQRGGALVQDESGPDDVFSSKHQNVYPHILIVTVPSGAPIHPLLDGESVTLGVIATSKAGPISLAGATVSWSMPVHGDLAPASDELTAVYTAPDTGNGAAHVKATVRFPDDHKAYTGDVTITFRRN